MKKFLLTLTCLVGFGLAFVAVPASAALVLTPGDMISGDAYGPSNCEPGCVETVFSTSDLTLLYKAGHKKDGNHELEGIFASSYSTEFWNSSTDPSNAAISYIDGMNSILCPFCYLAVKDGKADPGYYFFDLSNWNGTDTIEMLGFWGVGPGSISHVAIWGKDNGTPVPTPGALGLLGLGLAGLGLAARRRRSN